MSKYLFDVQEKNRLKQKGILKRFTSECYGIQHTLEEIRRKKATLIRNFKKKGIKSGKKYEWHFLKYEPSMKNYRKRKTKKKKKRKRRNRTKKKYLLF